MRILIPSMFRPFGLSVAALAIMGLGQGVANADEVFFAGNTNSCFGAACVPNPTVAFQPGITLLGLQYNNAVFSGTTADGFLAFGGNPIAGALNLDNLGSFTLSTEPNSYNGQSFTLRVTFTAPEGIAGGGSPLITATIMGQVVNATNGGVFLDFDNRPILFTFSDVNCAATSIPGQQTTCGIGSFLFFVQDRAINPGGTADLGGVIVSAQQSAIPEPTTMLLLGTGLVGVAGAVRLKLKGNKQN